MGVEVRTSQSRFALLGLLNLGPMSGYDLKQLIGWSIGHFWREGYGQIYPTLKDLEAEGLVRREERAELVGCDTGGGEAGESVGADGARVGIAAGASAGGRSGKRRRVQRGERPDRKVYALTDAGRERVREWLGQPAAEDVPRNETLLKLFFGGLVPGAVSLEHVAEERRRQQASLREYARIEQKLKSESGNDPQLRFWLMTLSYGRHVSQGVVDWADEVLGDSQN